MLRKPRQIFRAGSLLARVCRGLNTKDDVFSIGVAPDPRIAKAGLRFVAPTIKSSFRAQIVTDKGERLTDDVSTRFLRREAALQPGDLLLLQENRRRPQFLILPRPKCIILWVGGARVLVFAEQAMIFDGNRAGSAMDLASRLSDAVSIARGGVEGGPAFELVVLDLVLNMTVEKHLERVAFCRPIVERALERIGNDPDALFSLLPLQNTLGHFQSMADNLLSAIETLLNDEKDLYDSCLTDKALIRREEQEGMESRPPSEEASYNVEVLLESYAALVGQVRQEAATLARHIETRQTLLRTQLDALRNHLIEVELRVAFLGLGLGAGTLLAGVFGMNLSSGLEDSPGLFYVIGAFSVVFSILFYRSLSKYTLDTSPSGRHLRRVRSFLAGQKGPVRREGRAIGWLLGYGAPNSIVGDLQAVEASRVDPEQFRMLWKESTGRTLSDEQLFLIYAVFDADADDKLSLPEVAMLLGPGGSTGEPLAATGFLETERNN